MPCVEDGGGLIGKVYGHLSNKHTQAQALDYAAMSQKLGITFGEHFANELAALAPFEADGLVRRTADGVEVSDTGRLFIRNIAMCFDNTLVPASERRFSKTV